jgi:hypothetical protein
MVCGKQQNFLRLEFAGIWELLAIWAKDLVPVTLPESVPVKQSPWSTRNCQGRPNLDQRRSDTAVQMTLRWMAAIGLNKKIPPRAHAGIA